MATLLLTMPPVASHTLPMLSIASALTKRGHRVLVHTGQQNCTLVNMAGAELIPMSNNCNILLRVENSTLKAPFWIPNFALGFWQFRQEMLAMVPDMVAELETIIKRERVDCLIGDYLGFGASYVAEKLKIPFMTVAMSWGTTLNADGLPVAFPLPLPPKIVHTLFDFVFPLGRTRQQVGLAPRPKNAPAEFFSVVVSKLLNIVLVDRDFIPSQKLQEGQVFVGPTNFKTTRTTTDESPLGTSLKPGTVLLSTTTAANMQGELYRRTLTAIAEMGIPVLATVANDTDIPSGLGDNVRLESFVPHDEVVPYVKAIVTHGGAGMVGRAFRSAIPMLIIPDHGDQIATAIQAEKLGLAYYLPKNKANPKAIQSKLEALLKDHRLQERLKVLSEKLSLMDSPQLAAQAIEDILQDSAIKAVNSYSHSAK